jgi:hypothetical protein
MAIDQALSGSGYFTLLDINLPKEFVCDFLPRNRARLANNAKKWLFVRATHARHREPCNHANLWRVSQNRLPSVTAQRH